MSEQPHKGPLFVGIGNAWRGDDGVGPWIAQRLGELGLGAHTHAGDGSGLIDLFERYEDVVLIDATRCGAAAGAIVRFDAHEDSLPAELFHYSTHRFGLAEAVETARALGVLPKRLIVYGIEGRIFDAGAGLSPHVEQAAKEVVEFLSRNSGTAYGLPTADAASAG